MEIPQRTFTITKRKTNRYFSLACEIERELGIDKRQMFGLMKRKGIEKADELFRAIMKEDCDNRTSLYLYKLSELPNRKTKRKPRQLRLWKV